ncbi:putative GPI-anchored protein [Forsythia ovata]|uniref:GPI-anchored protein n=1 Tax=Forsythia ovata TaxID=205694 RepID=A0ABD1P5M4_9LAMI
MADQFKNQPCTNSTGSNTVPGTEPRFSDFPRLLSKCHLNVTVTRDGQILPACVPDLVPSLVVSNFTKSQYSGYLNDTKYTGVGIGSENDWMVVILTTSTPEGSFTPDNNSANLVSKFGTISHALLLFVIFYVLH